MAFPGYAGGAGPGYATGPRPTLRERLARTGPRPTKFWLSLAASIGVGGALLGLLVGALAFGGDDGARSASAARAEGAAAAKKADEGAAERAAAERRAARAVVGNIEARVNRIEHPVVAAAQAPTSGEVERVHVKAGGSVTTGQKLYTLREGKGARGVESVVAAPAAGRIERRAARGDRVEKGEVLAQLVDPAVWLIGADLPSDEPVVAWSCLVSTAEGRNRAACRLESVQRLGGQHSRVTASVLAEAAGWLQGGGQELLLTLSPPPGAPRVSGRSGADGAASSRTTGGGAPASSGSSAAPTTDDPRDAQAEADRPAAAPDSRVAPSPAPASPRSPADAAAE